MKPSQLIEICLRKTQHPRRSGDAGRLRRALNQIYPREAAPSPAA